MASRKGQWVWFPLLVILTALSLTLAFSPARIFAQNIELKAPTLPDGLGVNIHFTDPKPGEMEQLAAGGFRWVRMDLFWEETELKRGQYNFAAYDRLLRALETHHLRAIFILDYRNRLYDQGLSPYTAAGRQAFARWAAAAVRHFKGHGIYWEIYNEPNISFWRPRPHVENYIKLAHTTSRAIHRVAPQEIVVGPATAGIDLPFLERCFQAGLLNDWSAVTVHPYRKYAPETVSADFAQLRELIASYAPRGKQIPIISSEWGYSSIWPGMNSVKQGKMLPRQWLTNLANDIPLSIWYDWQDDGTNPNDQEHHFGTVRHLFQPNSKQAYEPKPAYLASQTLAEVLQGYHFNKRLTLGSQDDYVLLFSNNNDVRVAAWTTSRTPHQLKLLASPGLFQVVNHTGQISTASADSTGLVLQLTDAPQYFLPVEGNALLQIAAAWERLPLDVARPAQRSYPLSLSLRNPTDHPIQVANPFKRVSLQPGQRVTLTQPIEITHHPEDVPVQINGKSITARSPKPQKYKRQIHLKSHLYPLLIRSYRY